MVLCLMRDILKSGVEAGNPTPRFGELQDLRFNEVFCHPPANQLSVEEASYEMYVYFKYWVDVLNGESFEVFDTIDGRGLGIRATKLVSFGTLSLELVGFLEIIEYSLYAWLSTRGYPSLYHFYDIIAETEVYGIRFGPLALLVNTAEATVLSLGSHILMRMERTLLGDLLTVLAKSLKTSVKGFLRFTINIVY